LLVVPAHPEESYLLAKVGGMETWSFSCVIGPLMPVGAPKLSNADITSLRAWIEQGAKYP
jgi:hypothetical protein